MSRTTTTHPWWLAAAAAVPLLALGACGGDGYSRSEVAAGPEPGASPVSEAVFASAPIEPGIGPFAADDAAVWFTDFAALARYDVEGGEWTSLELPVDRDRVGGLTFVANGDGTASVLVAICDGTCDELDTQVTWQAYQADAKGLTEVPGLDLTTTATATAIGANADGAHFEFRDTGGNTQLVTVTAQRAAMTDTENDLNALCVTGNGFMGVQLAGDRGAAVLVGPTADALESVGVPAAADEALAGVEVSTSAVCTGDVLAVVGTELAWEFDPDGEVVEVPAHAPVPLGRGQVQLSPAVTVDGVTWVAGTGVNLRRDGSGWRVAEERPGDITAPRHTGYGAVGDVLLAYPPGDEPAGGPSVSANEGG